MQITKNENGQTLVQLSQEEWETYGHEAGYMKKASNETKTIQASTNEDQLQKIASLQTEIQFHQKEIQTKLAELSQYIGTKTEETEVETVKTDAFTEENYPNLIAEQQQQDGLIGVFAPRP